MCHVDEVGEKSSLKVLLFHIIYTTYRAMTAAKQPSYKKLKYYL